MTSVPLNNNNNHVLESEERDKVAPLSQLEQQLDLDDIWRESWSDEEDEGTKKQKRQLKAVGSFCETQGFVFNTAIYLSKENLGDFSCGVLRH